MSGKKQTQILDYFKKPEGKKDSGDSGPLMKLFAGIKRRLEEDNDKEINQNKKSSNGNTPLPKIESSDPLEVNFIDRDLFSCSFNEDEQEIFPINTDSGQQFNNNQYETFRFILKTIISDTHYENLFDENDWNQIQDITGLPGPVQLLYIKLYMRKRAWINRKNISYPEVNEKCDHSNEIAILVQHGFLDDSSRFGSLQEALEAMQLPEVKAFVKRFNGFDSKSQSKKKLIESFLNYVKTTKSAFAKGSSSVEEDVFKTAKTTCEKTYFRVNDEKSQLFDRIFLLYYSPNYLLDKIENLNTNDDHGWHRVVLGDYFVSPNDYPQLSTNKSIVLFESREESIQMTKAFETLCQVITQNNHRQFKPVAENLPDLLVKYQEYCSKYRDKDEKIPVWLRSFTATGMLVRVLNVSATALERTRAYERFIEFCKDMLAQKVYGIEYRPHWYTRASLVCKAHLKLPEQAEKFCLEGLKDETIEYHHRLDLYKRLKQINPETDYSDEFCKLYNETPFPALHVREEYRWIEDAKGRKNYFYSFNEETLEDEILPVEEVAIRMYAMLRYPKGIHCESSIYHAFFGLLFWDLLYSLEDVPDSFRYYSQNVPLDLKDSDFYKRRQKKIDERVSEIERFDDQELEQALTNSWTVNWGKVSLVNWDGIEKDQLMEIAKCFGGENLSKILLEMARHFRYLRKGLPDLIVWNPADKRIKVVEVKGPYDRLSDIQTIWMIQFQLWKIDAEVCYVRPYPKSLSITCCTCGGADKNCEFCG